MAVNFYKFAAAIMQLLEPENFNFNTLRSQIVQNGGSSQNPADAIQNSNAQIAADTNGDAQTILPDAEQEAETVQTIAAQLTQTIANASNEKVRQVAEAIKQVAANTEEATVADALTQTIETAKNESEQNSDLSTADQAATLVAATVETLAAETIQEIKSTNQEPNAPQVDAQAAINQENTSRTETVVTALTEKLIETAADTDQAIAHTALENSFAAADNNRDEAAQAPRINDFWDLYPEINPSDIKYPHALAYLYVYMASRDLLDFLNPEIALGDRQIIMTQVSGDANRYSSWESDLERNIRQSADNRADEARDFEREERARKARLNDELQQRLRIERQRLEERLRGA